MGNESPHAVVHRRSLAHRVFFSAGSARDAFLGNRRVGDFTPTVQRYYTGISLRRYVTLVCVEYPLIMLFSFLTWAVLPVSFLYMLFDLVSGMKEGNLHGFAAFLSMIGFLVATVFFIGAFFFVWAGIRSWASQGPSLPVRWYKKRRLSGRDPDFDDFPEKFPGPIALLKKWILSAGTGEASKITWDSGKRRVGW
jgi:hypothetical protein